MNQQEFGRAREMFPKALQEGKLMEYLGGFPGYGLFNPYADSPTDPSAAFNPIRSLIVEDRVVREHVLSALSSLANDQEHGWMAIYYISKLKDVEKNHGIELVTPELVSAIAEKLRNNKAHWNMNKSWVGWNTKDGLWGAVQGINQMLHENYNLTVLPEEL